MMANNFKKALLLLCSAATIGLAGCGEVTAELPKALQDEKIINSKETELIAYYMYVLAHDDELGIPAGNNDA